MPTPLRRRLRLARRSAAYGTAVALVLVAVAVGVVSQVLPLAERHPDRIAAWLSERAGRPVSFDHVKTQWTRRGPLLQLDGLRIGEGESGVSIGQAEVLVAMYGGFLPGHSFTELRLRGLSLTLQRADDGTWSVRGLPGQRSTGGDPLQSLEGLGELQVIGGKLAIIAPSMGKELQLPQIDLRLRVEGDRVRAGARAWIDRRAEPLRLAVDFDRKQGDGRAYLDVEADDFGVWSLLLRHGGVVAERGQGRVRGWAELRRHRVVLATIDAKLQGLGLRGAALAAGGEVPRVRFDQAEGLMRWRLVEGGWRLDARRLRVGTAPGVQTLDGLVMAGGRQYALLADQVDAAPLFAVLGLSDRVDDGLRRWLVRAKPRARLTDLSLVGRRGGPMRGKGHLSGVGFLPIGHAPGLSGLAGEVRGDAEGFELALDPKSRMRFDWPSGFGVVHDVDLHGKLVGWREGAGWRVATSALRVHGKDYAADVRGGLWFQGDGTRPWIDIAADLDDAPVPAAKGFWIHHSMPKAAVDWLNAALVGGTVRDGRAIVSGDLDDWPFRNNNGRFEAVGRIQSGQFKFQPDWPALEHVDADIAFIANGFRLQGRGVLAGVAIDSFEAGIEAFNQAELKIDAQASADAGRLLNLLRQSPLQKTYGETMANLEATGPVRASFNLLQPLHRQKAAQKRVDGMVDLQGAKLAEKRWNLAFADVRGKARYDDQGFSSEPLAVMHQGHAGVLALRAGSGVRDKLQAFEADLSAQLSARELLDRAPELAWLKPHLEGSSAWTVGVTIPRAPANANLAALPSQLSLRSNLVGTALNLPAPLRKAAAAPLAALVRAPLPMGSGQIEVALGDLLALRARSAGGQTGIRVALGGRQVTEPAPVSGLIVTGRTGSLDAMDWIALAGGGEGEGKLPLRHIDVTAARLLLIGSAFPDTRLQVAPASNAVAVALEGEALAGSLLVPDAKGAAISGKLSRVHWRSAAPAGTTTTPEQRAAANDFDPAGIPPLSLDIDDLRFGDASLGNAKMRTRQVASGMQVDQLQLRSPKQAIDVAGQWTGRGALARTRLNVSVDSQDLGALLDDLGYKRRLGGGYGQVKIDAGWAGSPAAFRLAALEGSVHIAARDGRLLELEPGAGRVLGLLSVAELRRRMMLDFSDFFSKGFAFNRIDGDIKLGDGLASSDALVIDGPSAEIRIRGETDLRAERFDQTVHVLPKSANVLTAVGAVAGGPIGAAVGAVANAVLKKPLGEMSAKTYRVTGPWKDPKVEVVSREQSRARTAGTVRQAGVP